MDDIQHAEDATQPTLRIATLSQRPRAPITRLVIFVLIGVFFVNAIGFTGLWVASVPKSAKTITSDLTARIAHISSLMNASNVFDATNLMNLQTEVNAASADLQKLNSLLPFGGAMNTSGATRLHHGLQMASDFCQAVQDLIGSILDVEPGLRAFLYSLIGTASNLQGDTNSLITLEQIHEAQRLLGQSAALWAQVTNERQIIGADPVATTFGISATDVNVFLHYLDATSIDYTHAIALISAVLDNLFLLLGVVQPAHLFVGLLDTDQLLPIGGAIGSYAWVEVDQGAATQSIHFQDISTLDCPKGCTFNVLPASFGWYTPPTGIWGVRDGGLSQSIITSGYAFHQLIANESNISANGILLITPNVLRDILQVIGAVAVPSIHITVTAKTILQDLEQAHQQAAASSQNSAAGIAQSPALDAAFANSIFAALAHATNAQLYTLGTMLIHDMLTKDLQSFTIYDRIQKGMGNVGVEGYFPSATEDSLSIVDTNMGQGFASNAVAEHITDHIVLDAAGQAEHTMTLTYTYQPTNNASSSVYSDLVQVLVPPGATSPVITGPCTPVHATVPNHVDSACRLQIAPGATVTLHVSWRTPFAQKHSYQLVLQRQAGALQFITITVATSNGALLSALSTGADVAKNVVTWINAPLLQDRFLNVGVA